MKKFFNKIKKLERKHMHELAVLSGTMALVIMCAVLVSSGIPRTAYAWIIYVYPVSYSPVTTGGNTTISWSAPTADYCYISGPTVPCASFGFGGSSGGFGGGGTCRRQQSFGGANGSLTTGPINGPTTYDIYCVNDSGGTGSSHAQGANSITVVPTPATSPTTLTSFTASPASIISGNTSVLSWSGTKGTNFSSCQVSGGQWGSGTSFSTLPGAVRTNPLTATTNYSVQCYDATYGWVGPLSVTVAVTPPAAIPVTANATSNSPRMVGQSATINFHADSSPVPGPCNINNFNGTSNLYSVGSCPTSAGASYTTPVYTSPGTYAYSFYYHKDGVWTLAKTVSVVVNAGSCANGLNSSYLPLCVCPSGQIKSGSSCIPAPVVTCPNGLANSYAPSCICPSGQVQSGSRCIPIAPVPVVTCPNGLANSYAPSCICPSGQVQSGSLCIPIAPVPVVSCSNGLANSYAPSCTCPSGQIQSGSLCIPAPVVTCSNGLANSYAPSCTCPSGQAQVGAACVPKGAINSITANPSRVLKGAHPSVTWSTSHMSACTLSSLDTAATTNLSTALSSTVTPAINGKTIFTLSCRDATGASYSSSVTVNLIPQTIEQ